MKNLAWFLTIFICASIVADVADAWPRRRRWRSNNYYSTSYSNYSFSGTTPQEVAEQKVALLASRGYGFHPGGGYGGGYFEGWGMSNSAEGARWNTCVPRGQNCTSARGSAVAQSANGTWFCINIW